MDELNDYSERLSKLQGILLQRALEDAKQRNILDHHIKCIKDAELHHLPFKVIKDYWSAEHKGKVLLNYYFPLPGVAHDKLLGFDIVKDGNEKCYYINNNKRIYKLPTPQAEYLTEDAKQRLSEHLKSLKPYDYGAKEGFNTWKKYYLHFLDGYDFKSFSVADMFGNSEHTQEELKQAIKHYEELQQEYKNNKKLYLNSEPDLENEQDTTTDLFYWDFSIKQEV